MWTVRRGAGGRAQAAFPRMLRILQSSFHPWAWPVRQPPFQPTGSWHAPGGVGRDGHFLESGHHRHPLGCGRPLPQLRREPDLPVVWGAGH